MPVAHVEAGLRSFDRAMPEEINRVVTDQLADLLFVHSREDADENLAFEGVPPERIHPVGNTMIDTLVRCGRGSPGRRRRRPGLARGHTSWSRCTGRRWSTGPLLGAAVARSW